MKQQQEKPKKPLNPPQFEVKLLNFHNPRIAWYTSVIKTKGGRFL